MSPDLAATLAGKMVFMQSAMFGKVGRAVTRPLYRRQHAPPWASHRLGLALRHSLLALQELLASPMPHTVPWARRRHPTTVVYTDAFVEVDIANGRRTPCDNGVGLVLFASGTPRYFFVKVPDSVLLDVPINDAFIFFLEFLAQLFIVILFGKELSEDVLSFIDNTPAKFVLLAGYSRNEGVNNLVGLYWVLCSKLGLRPWFEWVPSAANIADAISREDFELAETAGWHRVAAE
eukprot:6474591-Amphidinium_carterae.1